MTEITKIGEVREPYLGYVQELLVVPAAKLRVIEIQRRPSKYHVRRLADSIRRVGFVIPLVAIRRDNEFVIIDGQHRFLAGRELGIERFPVVVLPEKYANNLMELNVEKQMSLREKAYVALNVYRRWLEEDRLMREDDGRVLDSIENAYYVTLGIAYEKNPKIFGSALETILKRVDGFLDLPLEEAIREREKRALIVLNIDELVREAVEKVKSVGIDHPFIYKEVVSFCNPIKRKRRVEQSFLEVFSKLEENLRDLMQMPEKIRGHEFGSISPGEE